MKLYTLLLRNFTGLNVNLWYLVSKQVIQNKSFNSSTPGLFTIFFSIN